MMEGENADKFRKNFAGTPWIKVPRILWDYTSEQVGSLVEIRIFRKGVQISLCGHALDQGDAHPLGLHARAGEHSWGRGNAPCSGSGLIWQRTHHAELSQNRERLGFRVQRLFLLHLGKYSEEPGGVDEAPLCPWCLV